MSNYWTNITLKELKDAVAYAEQFGVSEYKTIRISFTEPVGNIILGTTIKVSTVPHGHKVKDITNIDSF